MGENPKVEHDMDTEIHKDPTKMKCGFVSNNQVAADRRGGPRPRRRRKKNANGDAALPDPVYVFANPEIQPGFNGQWRMKMPPWQEQEVFGPSGLLPHMDEEVEASAHDHQHPPTNQHPIPIGYGNGGQPQKGWPPLP